MQCRIFRDPVMNRQVDSDPNHIETLGKYYPKRGRPYKDMDEFSSMILDIKKDERRIDPQSGEYFYYKKQSTTLRTDYIPFFLIKKNV